MVTAIEAIFIIADAPLIAVHASVGNGAGAGNASVNGVNGVNMHGVSANGTAIAVAMGIMITTGIVASIDSRFLKAGSGRSCSFGSGLFCRQASARSLTREPARGFGRVMEKSATDLMQDSIVAAVLDAITAWKTASGGLPNVLARELGAVHRNTTLADLPKEVQTAVRDSTRATFNRLLKEGYTVAKGAPTRPPPIGSRPPRIDGSRQPRGPGKPPIVETKRPPRGGGPSGGGRGGPQRSR